MDYNQAITDILTGYEKNGYTTEKIKHNYKKIADGVYQLQIPVKEKVLSDAINKYIVTHMDFYGLSKSPTTFEGIEGGVDKHTFMTCHKTAYEEIEQAKSLEELYQFAQLVPFFTAFLKVPAQIKKSLKTQFETIQRKLAELTNQTQTQSNPSMVEGSSKQTAETNASEPKQNIATQKNEEVVVAQLVNAPLSSLALIQQSSKKKVTIDRELTHIAKNFQIEKEISEVLGKIKKEYGYPEFELVNLALRTFIEVGYPEYLQELKSIDVMNYKVTRQ